MRYETQPVFTLTMPGNTQNGGSYSTSYQMPPDPDDGGALVRAPLSPRPTTGGAGVALELPVLASL